MIKEIITQKTAGLTKSFELIGEQKELNHRYLRWLGWFAIVLGFAVIIVGKFIYRLDYSFTSISASANFYGTAYLLPFVLGGMAIFFWGYIGYAKIDRILTRTMSVAVFFVAMFQCNEFGCPNNIPPKTSLLGLPPEWSGTIHLIAAVVLFLSLIIWIACLFTLTEENGNAVWKLRGQTPKKKLRNILYWAASIFIFIGLVFTVLNLGRITKVPYV